MSKKRIVKWNKAHVFARKKSTSRQVGHPVYIYGRRGPYRKYLTFTHKPEDGEEANYEKLNHNIDPEETKKDSYVKKQFGVSHNTSFREPDKNYRIHDEDKEIVKRYKK